MNEYVSYFTDYTKPKNYNKRAHKLLKWFELLLSKPAVLRDKTFQKGIHLPKHLQDKMTEIAIDWTAMKRVLDMHSKHKTGKTTRRHVSDSSTRQSDSHRNGQYRKDIQHRGSNKRSFDDDEGAMSNEEYTAHQSGLKRTSSSDQVMRVMSQQQIESLLTKLQQQTEAILVDVTFEQESMAIHSGNYDATKIDAAKCFDLCDVLPSFLMPIDPLRSEPFHDNKQMINAELLKMMDDDHRETRDKYLESVDKIAYEIRDLILSNCELLKD